MKFPSDISPLRRQAADVLRRARKLPAGHDRNDLRQLAVGLLWLEKKGLQQGRLTPILAMDELRKENPPAWTGGLRAPSLTVTAWAALSERPTIAGCAFGSIGADDFRVTIHRSPDAGWHATICGRQPAEVHRCQVMADPIAAELCQHYELDE
jgi:hypothetical protein